VNKYIARRNHWYVCGLLVSAWALGARPAGAEALQSQQRARALFDAAGKELDARGPAKACPMFEEVVAIAPDSVGGWTMLGDCRKREGRLASAFRAYTEAAEVAKRLGHIARSEQAARYPFEHDAHATDSPIRKPRAAGAIEGRLVDELCDVRGGHYTAPFIKTSVEARSIFPLRLIVRGVPAEVIAPVCVDPSGAV